MRQELIFMTDNILVVVEQREGKLNRVSWETIEAGQAIASQTGWTLEGAVVGSGVAAIAGEVAAKRLAKVYDVESAKLEPYTPDAFAYALKEFLATHPARLVLMPHTYQVRDFVPKLATALKTTAISDVIGCKVRRRQAAVHTADVPGEIRGRCQLCGYGSVLCDLPERIVSRG